MQSVTPVLAVRESDWVEVAVTDTWGGAGSALDNTANSTSVMLRNIGAFAFEYRVDSGDWTRLEVHTSVNFDVSLASATIRLRKAEFGDDGLARFEIESLTGQFVVSNDHPVSGPGGATAFTQLTDAPATIAPHEILAGSPEGSGVVFVGGLSAYCSQLGSPGIEISSQTSPSPNDAGVGLSLVAATEGNNPRALAFSWASNYGARADGAGVAGMGVTVTLPSEEGAPVNNTQINLLADQDGAHLQLQGDGPFLMDGFDVVASDTSARLTVNAVEYSVAKAVKVKIGGATYFWPLFGPVAP